MGLEAVELRAGTHARGLSRAQAGLGWAGLLGITFSAALGCLVPWPSGDVWRCFGRGLGWEERQAGR